MDEYLAYKVWDVDGKTILRVVKLSSDEERRLYIKANKGYNVVDSLLVQHDSAILN